MTIQYTWLPADTPYSSNCLNIVQAQGSHLLTKDGQKIYDGISSWWCKPLGHRHELVLHSINEQLNHFEHHIPANAYNDTLEALSATLLSFFTEMNKVMYASDGSSAVEIAMKLSYETRIINNQPKRSKFISLKGNYHGETLFTLSVCGLESYRSIYQELFPENIFIDQIPYVSSRTDPLWNDCGFAYEFYNAMFARVAPECTALILEPIVQGAAGLKIISRDFLVRLIELARQYGLHIISDEIMVGLGRLGCHSVSKQILGVEPDLACFAKNLTAGSIPMSAVVINKSISDCFAASDRPFHHSHTHSCNALAAKVALNYLGYLKQSKLAEKVLNGESKLYQMVQEFHDEFDFVNNPRAIGAIGAFELDLEPEIIQRIFLIGIDNGIYLRPINKSLYIMPPLYNLSEDLVEVKAKMTKVLQEVQRLRFSITG